MITVQLGFGLVDVLPLVIIVVSILLWATAFIFLVANLIWAVEVLVLRSSRMPGADADGDANANSRYGPDDMQVRVLTIDAADVVQRSVSAIPDELTDRHVIAEEPMEIDGAAVHVVPDSFECNATRKGRALEWARLAVPCDREYVLYIDEDSIISDVPELPEADIIQYRECPVRSDSLFTYLSELFRMGFQIEQQAFSALSVPLYAWGGGIAVRKELEDQITWDYETIIEDTVFVWTAATSTDVDFVTASTKFYNQSPPTVMEMIHQRRRWIAGAVTDLHLLPRPYRILFMIRNVAWCLSPIVPLLVLVPIVMDSMLFNQLYLQVSLFLTAFLYSWSILGVWYSDESVSTTISLLLLTPLISLLHSLGAFVGFVSPVHEFNTTRKVEQIHDTHATLGERSDESLD